MNGPLLSARNLSYEVGRVPLVQDCSLELKAGEFVGLIGPNGSGKSTLLRLLSGFLRPSSGSVILGERELKDYRARERARLLSVVTQEGPESFAFTGRDLVEMGLFPQFSAWGGLSSGDKEKVDMVLEKTGVEAWIDRPFPTLSGGERQLVLFARALVQNTPVLLLDEPTSGLDLGHEHQLLSICRKRADEGRAVLCSVHNLGVAARLCHRLMLLHRGRIVAQGRPEDVVTAENLELCYHVKAEVDADPLRGGLSIHLLG